MSDGDWEFGSADLAELGAELLTLKELERTLRDELSRLRVQ